MLSSIKHDSVTTFQITIPIRARTFHYVLIIALLVRESYCIPALFFYFEIFSVGISTLFQNL